MSTPSLRSRSKTTKWLNSQWRIVAGSRYQLLDLDETPRPRRPYQRAASTMLAAVVPLRSTPVVSRILSTGTLLPW
jgi:hypothetical protein